MHQDRWNEFGTQAAADVESHPEDYVIGDWRSRHAVALRDALLAMDLTGREVLDIGCGRGEMTTWLAKRGARMSGIDLGPDLVAAAQAIATLNGVEVDLHTGSITELPFDDGRFDVVVGKAILHHLSPEDVLTATREAHRVLAPGGTFIVYETLEDSRFFDAVQNIVPRGRAGDTHYRPSILQRAAWRTYLDELDDRAMVSAEFEAMGEVFGDSHLVYSGLTTRLANIGGNRPKVAARLLELDDKVLARVGFLRRYARNVVAAYTKSPSAGEPAAR